MRLDGTSCDESLINLQNRLLGEVNEEFEAQRSVYNARWALESSQRINYGRCISGLVLDREIKPTILRFSCQENLSDLRAGDVVRLSYGDPRDPILTGAVIYEEGPDYVCINIRRKVLGLSECLSNRLVVIDEDFIDLEDYYKQALDDLLRTEVGRNHVSPLLMGKVDQEVDMEAVDKAMEEASDEGANDAQAEAIGFASEASRVYVVHGPPGTGKTHVLAQVIKNRVARGERVLVTSLTHRAINNALAAFAKCKDSKTFVGRVGPVFEDPQLSADNIEFKENFHDLSFHDSGGEYVIGATPFATRTRRLKGIEFDTVIFDEASQVTIPLAVMGMLAGKTYLFFGDNKQLPPVLNSVSQREANKHSIFGLLKGKGYDTLLNITYRMNDVITGWSSDSFYSSKLIPHPDNAKRRLSFSQPGKDWDEILNPDMPLVLVPTSIQEKDLQNHEEANLVVYLLRELIDRGISLKDIGVVVPFRRQARLISRRLWADDYLAAKSPKDCVIDTVERMQGQEREVIICSMTAADHQRIGELWDFLYQPERLNVTVTRAKSKFIWLVSEAFFSDVFGSIKETDQEDDRAFFYSLRDASFTVRLD